MTVEQLLSRYGLDTSWANLLVPSYDGFQKIVYQKNDVVVRTQKLEKPHQHVTAQFSLFPIGTYCYVRTFVQGLHSSDRYGKWMIKTRYCADPLKLLTVIGSRHMLHRVKPRNVFHRLPTVDMRPKACSPRGMHIHIFFFMI